jgi:beta-lactamase regulating signal transducer with metallopeptidase domain
MNNVISYLNTTADQFAAQLFLWSLQAIVLVILAQLLLRFMRTMSHALRHNIWVITLLSIATLPLLSLVPLSTPQQRLRAVAASYVPELSGTTVLAPSSVNAEVSSDAWSRSLESILQRSIPYGRRAVFFAWLAGVALLLTRIVSSQFSLYLAFRTARPPKNIESALDSVRAVQIRLSERVSSPLLFGFFHPAILLPADILEWTTPEERKAMIDHELAHAKRRDPITNLLQSFIRVAFFFHPIVRYACHQATLAREMACDERVLSLGNRSSAYAEGILKVAERCLGSHAHQVALFSTRHLLERRIDVILNTDLRKLPRVGATQLVLPAAILVTCAWFLVPGRPVVSVHAATIDTQAPSSLESLYEQAARTPDANTRATILRHLAILERAHNTEAMTKLYGVAVDPAVKRSTIDSLARLEEIGALVTLARTEPDTDLRKRLLLRIRNLKMHSENVEVRNSDVSGLENELQQIPDAPPPPPPPPPPAKRAKMPPPPPPPPADGVVPVDVKKKVPKPPPPPPPPPKKEEN